MKTLKTGDTITISKPGLLNGSTGKIIEIDETKRKPIKALVDNGGGEWQLEYSEVQNNAPTALKSSDTPKEAVKYNGAQIEVIEKTKRKYSKRDKVEVKVTKRKYTKKEKN